MRHAAIIIIIITTAAGCFVDSQAVGDSVEASGSSSSGGTGDDEGTDTAGDTEGASEEASTGEAGDTSAGDEETSTGEAGDTSDDSSGSGDTGPWACDNNDQCAPGEVCSEQQCIDAWLVPHALRVTAWDEPCDGAGTNTFFVRVGAFDSVVVGCPQGWPSDWFTVGPGASVRLDFYEKGGAPNPDQLVTQWCWDTGLGCGPIPKAVLQAGGATVQWGSWSATVELQPL